MVKTTKWIIFLQFGHEFPMKNNVEENRGGHLSNQNGLIHSSPTKSKLVSFDGHGGQSFSSTYLHFNDDSGGFLNPDKARIRKVNGQGRQKKQDRNEGKGPKSRYVMAEPPVERVYRNFSGTDSKVVSQSLY